jgi:hypothetical protein
MLSGSQNQSGGCGEESNNFPCRERKSDSQVVKVVQVVPVLNLALRHEGKWGRECIDPHFLDLGTSWRWAVCFTPRPLYPRGKSPWYPLDTRLGGHIENTYPSNYSNVTVPLHINGNSFPRECDPLLSNGYTCYIMNRIFNYNVDAFQVL